MSIPVAHGLHATGGRQIQRLSPFPPLQQALGSSALEVTGMGAEKEIE